MFVSDFEQIAAAGSLAIYRSIQRQMGTIHSAESPIAVKAQQVSVARILIRDTPILHAKDM